MSDISPTPHQSAAMTTIVEGVKAGQPLQALKGLAGTGKTQCIPWLREQLAFAGNVVVAAPTHRAASILRNKGIQDADTVHSLAMVPRFTPEYDSARIALGDVLPDSVQDASHDLIDDAKATWLLPVPFPSWSELLGRARRYGASKALRSIGIAAKDHMVGYGPKVGAGAVLILDEASMVGEALLQHCLSAFKHVILVGDPGQLPPVKDVAVLHSVAGVTLQEIHRQAADSKIVQLAYAARAGRVLWQQALTAYAPDVQTVNYAPAAQLHDVPILVWRNTTRVTLTQAIRAARGYAPGALYVGEPLVCRSTDREDRMDGYCNNALFRIVETYPGHERLVSVVPDGVDDAPTQLVRVHMEEIDGAYVEPGSVACRFGYVFTAHTAQGGEWERVVIDLQDLLAHRGMAYARGNIDEAAQWQYTAITRAKKHLLLLDTRRIV